VGVPSRAPRAARSLQAVAQPPRERESRSRSSSRGPTAEVKLDHAPPRVAVRPFPERIVGMNAMRVCIRSAARSNHLW
jgi:hypothetical protein